MDSRLEIKNLVGIKKYDSKGIVLAFTLLRFVAACLITNTHYNDVYPIRALAVGGLLGDVLFFIVSGFVLSRPTKQRFIPWYIKRIVRIYPAVISGVAIYLVTGYETLKGGSWFYAFVFPTFFVFAAAIILLYIPLYFVNKIQNRKYYLGVILGVLALYMLVYVFILDKSIYQMNDTGNLMIAFPYFLGMLYGGYLRKFGIKKKGNVQTAFSWFAAVLFCAVYFAVNNMVRSNEAFYPVQILVPGTLLIAVGFLVLAFYFMEDWFRTWPAWLLTAINFIAALTLEIYVVQKPIIQALAGISFPCNWLIITALIIAAAVILRIAINLIITCIKIGAGKVHIK